MHLLTISMFFGLPILNCVSSVLAIEYLKSFKGICFFSDPNNCVWYLLYNIQALFTQTSSSRENIAIYQRCYLIPVLYNDTNMSTKSTPPILVLYSLITYGQLASILHFTFLSYRRTISLVSIVGTKELTKVTHLLSTHLTTDIFFLLSDFFE